MVGFEIMILCPSGATCLSSDNCFSELLVRKDMGVNEHERLSTFRHKLKEQCLYCCSKCHGYSRVFINEQIFSSYINNQLKL